MIGHVVVYSDNMMQSQFMPCQHPEGPVLEWPEIFHDVLDNSPFILYCEESLVMTIFWTLKLLAGKFS